MKAVIIRLIQYSEAVFSMKASLETLNLEINLKTFTHIRLKSISYTIYNQHPSLPLSKLKLVLKHMPVMNVILPLT